MDHSHVVDVHIYITDGAHLGLCRRIRDEALKGHRAAATVVVVAGLAAAEMVVEVTVVAASPR
jgi:enamine deaminase RidA (YjgF/YER057c/UK114 family)